MNTSRFIRLYLVKDDTPVIVLEARDRITGVPIDISNAATEARLKVRLVGSATLKADIVCTKLTGQVLANGQVDHSSPYDLAGFGGRCMAECDATVFDTAGKYEGELQLVFGATSKTATPYQRLDIDVRADF